VPTGLFLRGPFAFAFAKAKAKGVVDPLRQPLDSLGRVTTRGFKTLCSARARKGLRKFLKQLKSSTAALERTLASLKDHITKEQWEGLNKIKNGEATSSSGFD
jgi:hypothetical protein